MGKSKTRGHVLPPIDYTYGVKYEKINGGVQEALHHWANSAKDSQTRDERFKLVRDFVALNKEAIKSGCTTTKQNDQYRALHDIRKKVRVGGGGSDAVSSVENGFSKNKMVFPPGMTFGQPHVPSFPIAEVLEYRYLHDWLREMERQEAEAVIAKKEASKAISGAYHTKSSWLKNAKIPVEEKPLWKMPRFRNVEAAVDSFRTESQRAKALSVNYLDKVPREGVNAFEQGVYTVNTTSLPS